MLKTTSGTDDAPYFVARPRMEEAKQAACDEVNFCGL